MKKTYIMPQSTVVLLAPAAMLAASEPVVHDEVIDGPQLSNHSGWTTEEWAEE